MAPVKFTRPPDLSGRTPIYRLSKTAPSPAATPTPTPPQPSPSSQTATWQPPYTSPYTAGPQPQSQSQSQTTPHDDKENQVAQSPHQTQSSPLTKRRGRKLQENEILILINCCLEFQSLYHGNPSRFWYSVATSLKRQIKRNFSWQSCRQIIEELVSERRERRRDVAEGKVKEQPLTELVLTTDKWISFSDSAAGSPSIASPAQSLKRPGEDGSPAIDPSAAKRPKQHGQPSPSMPPPGSQPLSQSPHTVLTHPMSTNAVPSIPTGPTRSEFQTLKVDIQSLRMDVQSMRREMVEARQEMNTRLDIIMQTLQQVKAQSVPKEE